MDVEFEKKFQLAMEELDKRSRRCIISTGEMTYDFLLEDIMLTGVVRKETINYIFENDKMIYDYIKFVYDQAEFIGTVEQTFMENIALEARVFCDSERENALAKQAVDGIEIDDSDCWLSSYTTKEHWLVVDLDSEKTYNRFIVKHHPLKKSLITQDFRIEVSSDSYNCNSNCRFSVFTT